MWAILLAFLKRIRICKSNQSIFISGMNASFVFFLFPFRLVAGAGVPGSTTLVMHICN